MQLKKYMLLQDIVGPEGTIPKGTMGIWSKGDTYCFSNGSTFALYFKEDSIIATSDWFEEIQPPKWTDDQLLDFTVYLLLGIPNAPTMERIENDFENWKKEKGYE